MTAEREGVAELEQHIEVLRELRDDYHLCGPTEYSEALDAAIRALRQGGGWLPIESAPKDGTLVLGCICPEHGAWDREWVQHLAPVAISFRGFHPNAPGKKQWRVADGKPTHPTHWQSLPAPPPPPARRMAVGRGEAVSA